MKTFTYKAKDAQGATVKGKVEAEDEKEAARILREKGLIVIALSSPYNPIVNLWLRLTNRITLSDIAVFTRQLATMISSGLPITDSLIIIQSQSSPGLALVTGRILSDVEGGSSLAKALAKHPRVFSPVFIALIRAGEEGGVLDKVILRLADNLESEKEFRAKVKGALIYTTIVIIGMGVVGMLMMTFVVPKLTSIYTEFEANLPFATKALIKIASFFESFWWVMIGVLGALIWGFSLYKKTSRGRKKVDEIKLKLPVAGPLTRQVILDELTRTLGMLSGAGVPILESLKISAGVVGNVIISEAIGRVSKQVEKGFPVASALSQEPQTFPPMLYQLVAVGEETGKVDEAFLKIARVFEQEAEYSVKNLTAAVEPLVMIVLGIGVAFLVIAIILLIYNLTSQF